MNFEICQMILFSVLFDAVGLYPNIPHKEGLEAIRKALNKREDQTISTDSLILLAGCVLKNNVFEHNLRYFKQLNETAIGTKLSPPYAILFMGYLEDKNLNSFVEKPLVWGRYIDDNFMIWQHGKETLKEFLKILNSCHPTIKFIPQYSLHKISFWMPKLYQAETNSLQILISNLRILTNT